MNGDQAVSAELVRSSCISTSTKKAYQSYISMIRKWIIATLPDPDQYFDEQEGINLDYFTPAHFEAFLLSRVNTPGKSVKVGTLSGYRSAIKDIYRKNKRPIPSAYDDDLKTFFSGLKRLEAESVQSGASQNSGKRPIKYSTYLDICKSTMLLLDGGFSHLFLTTQWNLMCRSKSVQTLDTSHLSSEDDSIGCTFHKTKTNQDGSGPKDPRHIFANPFSPFTCWFTALGVYFACNTEQGPGPLFPGSNQRNRFGKVISRLLNHDTAEYGTHSVRKGVATFACGGSTAGPSIVSVCLRCGWSIGGVQDRYLRYEAAGDQFLGRVVAGLPINKAEFLVLPPHFSNHQDEFVLRCTRTMFPLLSQIKHLENVLVLCLASLVVHSDTLSQDLPTCHPLLSTYVFRDRIAREQLQTQLNTTNPSWMTPSGIPPHVEMYNYQVQTRETLKELPNIVIAGVEKIIEDKGVCAGNITRDLLKDTIRELVLETNTHWNETPNTTTGAPTYQLHLWDGKLHALPQDFDFPSVDTLSAWKLWWFGNPALGYPPFRRISSHDLSTKKKRNTLSEWKAMMRVIVDSVENNSVERIGNIVNEDHAVVIYNTAKQHLPIEQETIAHSARRTGQLKMVTALRLIRQSSQTARPQPYRPRKRANATT
jgi:hypothetical protein